MQQRRKSQRDKEILDYIERYTAKHNREPTYAEICEALGIKSKATIAKHIAALEREGLLKSRPFVCFV